MSEVELDRNGSQEGKGERERERSANQIVGYRFMVANGPGLRDEALNSTNKKEWTKPINSVLESLERHNKWSVVSTSNYIYDNL